MPNLTMEQMIEMSIDNMTTEFSILSEARNLI